MKSARKSGKKKARLREMAAASVATSIGADIAAIKLGTAATSAPGAIAGEKCQQVIELASHFRAERNHVTPETDLRDWLDARREIERAQVN